MMFPAPPDPTRQPQLGYVYDPEIRYVYAPNDKGYIDDGFVTINARDSAGTKQPSPNQRAAIGLPPSATR